MSPTKRPSAVDGLRRGVGTVPAASANQAAAVPDPAPAGAEPKARVTLNLPASMYRDIERWTTEAAGTLGVPRVGIQDAMRAMLQAVVLDKSIGLVAIDLLRRERGA